MRYLPLLLLSLLVLSACGEPATWTDVVRVDYIGRDANGTVFDTNIEAVAMEHDLYNENRAYVPLELLIGEQSVIRGFEEAIVGMRPGQTKTVELPPGEAYGPYARGKVSTTQRVQRAPRITTERHFLDVPRAELEGQLPSINLGDPVKIKGLTYVIAGLSQDFVGLMLIAEPGDTIQLADTPWPGTIIAIDDENMTVRQDPQNNTIIETPFGAALLTITEEEIITTLLLEVGDIWSSSTWGTGTVIALNETDVTIDFNHPLAGKTLEFEITLLEILEK